MPILTAADSLRLGATAVNRVYAGAKKVWPPNYLDASIGSCSTPDPGVPPQQCVWVFKVIGSTGVIGTLCSQYEVDPNRSWLIRRQATGTMTANLVPAAGTAASSRAITTATVPAIPPKAVPEVLALALDQDVTNCRMWRQDNAGAWVADATPSATISPLPLFDSTTVMRIGTFSATSTPWVGRIYWIELRTGLDPAAGTLLWRFDASEYPGTGTSWTDARGRVWTLITASSIVVP